MRWRSLIGLAGPAKVIRAKLNAMIPPRASRQWILAARLQAPDGRLLVFDPVCYWPSQPDPRHVYDLTLHAPPGEVAVHLEVLRISRWHQRIAAVKIIWADDQETHREQIGEVCVDSATLAISPAAELPRRWRIGGSRNRSALMVSYLMGEAERNAEIERAIKVLAAKGFRLRKARYGPEFALPLDDEQMARATAALHEAGYSAEVYANPPHSGALIEEQIRASGVATLDDHVSPYLVAFTSGWGDGTYQWYALSSRERVFGCFCWLIGPDD